MHDSIDLRTAVRDSLAGDPAATEVLARRACLLALRTAAVITSSREVAADISQDVAIDVLRSLAKLREPEAFDGWVHRITIRHVSRALKHRSARRRAETPLALVGEPNEPVAPDGPDHATLIATRKALTEALADLPVKQRLALALRYVHDLSDADIAASLDCRVGTAHALLSRGRAAMRRHPQLAELAPAPAGREPR